MSQLQSYSNCGNQQIMGKSWISIPELQATSLIKMGQNYSRVLIATHSKEQRGEWLKVFIKKKTDFLEILYRH